ncbi:hypothetical protein AB0C81_26510 [Streptomyces roseoverticillatus]|uniref:hypothetical protein n=1 Tax=Streptomyces roseoverticillatus TaxID=66429 RepID=UPI0033F07689
MTEDRPMQAEEALARMRELDAVVRRQSRWGVRYLALFALASLAFTYTVGMLHGEAIAVATVAWIVFVAGTSLWAARQQVHREGYARRQGLVMVGWGTTYAIAVSVGSDLYAGNPAWWAPAAVATAVPAAIGAVVESRV